MTIEYGNIQTNRINVGCYITPALEAKLKKIREVTRLKKSDIIRRALIVAQVPTTAPQVLVAADWLDAVIDAEKFNQSLEITPQEAADILTERNANISVETLDYAEEMITYLREKLGANNERA